MIILASLLTSLAFAGTIDVYVSPITFVNRVSNEAITISHELDAPFYYSSMYARSAKMKNGRGGYETIEKARVYGKDTIKHAHPDCNYRREPLDCSIKNEHYYVETIATYNNDQMIFRSVLYGPEGTHYGKEELPLKWEIPYKLLQHDVQQTIKGLWTGIKLD